MTRAVRIGVAAAAVAVLALAAGCREEQWPSDADPAVFCDRITSVSVVESEVPDDLRSLGTPENIPYEARRYLIELDEGEEPPPGDEQVFEKYLAGYC